MLSDPLTFHRCVGPREWPQHTHPTPSHPSHPHQQQCVRCSLSLNFFHPLQSEYFISFSTLPPSPKKKKKRESPFSCVVKQAWWTVASWVMQVLLEHPACCISQVPVGLYSAHSAVKLPVTLSPAAISARGKPWTSEVDSAALP